MSWFSRDDSDTRTTHEVVKDIRDDIAHRTWCGSGRDCEEREHGTGRNGEQGGLFGRRH